MKATTKEIVTKSKIDEKLDKIDAKAPPFDLYQAFSMRFNKHMPYRDIAKILNVPKSNVYYHLKRFEDLLKNNRKVEIYQNNKRQFINAGQFEMFCDILDKDKRKKATIGNAGYVWDKFMHWGNIEEGKATENIDHHHLVSNIKDSGDQVRAIGRELGIEEGEYMEDLEEV